jgi:hypothetical protein
MPEMREGPDHCKQATVRAHTPSYTCWRRSFTGEADYSTVGSRAHAFCQERELSNEKTPFRLGGRQRANNRRTYHRRA